MNQLLEWLPLIVFFVAFKVFDIYWATAALMLACTLQLLVHRLRFGHFKTMHLVTCLVVVVLGTATLLLHDKRFIQWKASVLLTLSAAVLLASVGVGKQPLVRRMFDSVFEHPLSISTRGWRLLTVLWALWLSLLALLNLYVARNFTESVWVNYKVIGIPVAMVLFLIPQVIWMSGKTAAAASPCDAPGDAPCDAPSDAISPAGSGASLNATRAATPDAAWAATPAAARAQRLRERLESRFSPASLSIEDESALHEGHAGAAGGLSHFRVRIVSEAFRGIPALARHRLVYAALDDMLKSDIHALAIEASVPIN